MSGKEHWRIEKRRDVSGYGKEITSKANAYIETWRSRCYSDLPEEVPMELMLAGLAPSWKALAIAILSNRWNLIGIYPTGWIAFEATERDSEQLDLFLDNDL